MIERYYDNPPSIPGIYVQVDRRAFWANTVHQRFCNYLLFNLELLYRNDPNVTVARDLMWFPLEGRPKRRVPLPLAVIVGRPNVDRKAYLQWQEAGIAPQVVFDFWSPGPDFPRWQRQLACYKTHGVEEYYVYNPVCNAIDVWFRSPDGKFKSQPMKQRRFTSPRLGVTFHASVKHGELRAYRPDGSPFLTHFELEDQLAAERKRADSLAALLRQNGIEPPA